MKADALFQFVKSLSEEESTRFLSLVRLEQNGEDLARIVNCLLGMEKFHKTNFRKCHRVSSGRLETLLEEISPVVYNLMANQNEAGKLHNALLTARRLVFRQADQAAIEVMQWAFAEAERVERFDIALDLLELTTIIITPYEHEMPNKGELIRKQMNLLAYQELEEQFRQFLTGKKSSPPSHSLEDFRSSQFLKSENEVKSNRARAIFHKINAVIFMLSGNSDEAENFQRSFLDLIKDNPWINIEKDFFFVRESVRLSTILVSAGKVAEANELVFRIGNRQCSEARSENEKFLQLFPFKITVGILAGDSVVIDSSIQTFIRLYKNQGKSFTLSFAWLNLYFCAYGHIVSRSHQKATRIFHMAGELRSPKSYLKRIQPMFKILKMVNLIHLDELEQVPALINRFRNSSKFEMNPFFRTVLGVLFRLANKSKTDWPSVLEKSLEKARQLKKTEYALYFDYFELEYWLESMIENRPMADTFHHRAKLLEKDEESRRVG